MPQINHSPFHWLTAVLPILVLAAASLVSWILAKQNPTQPVAEATTASDVKVITAQPRRLRIPITSQGLVQSVHEAELSMPVQGRILAVNPAFVIGGIVKANQMLVKIDPSEYDLAIVRAQAQVAEMQRTLSEQKAAAIQAKREWQELGEGKPTALSMREPQLAEAKAKLKLAEAELALAYKNRRACDFLAPISGKISAKSIILGQFATFGQNLGRMYALDSAEIRLPVTLKQSSFLDFPESAKQTRLPKVLLSIGNVQREAELIRREGRVDSNNGLEYWVASLAQPEKAPALYPGSFVHAHIQSRELDGVFVLPQTALTTTQQVLLVNQANRLHIKSVNVLQTQDEEVWIDQGLNLGDKVVLSGVDIPVEGMMVNVLPD